jgi:inosine-uridine nucleoside N-ribohydrolase
MDIFLDTDIGDDIDDALALTLVLRSSEVQLRGVTTVFRNAPRRAAFTRQLLRALKHDVPIYAGISKPLLQPFEPQLGAQMQWLEDDMWTERGHAVDAIIAAARVEEEPDEPLTVVAIGPLTNIAAAIVREPELVPRLRLVVMGGCFSEAYNEWNIGCDPEAAAIVVESGVEISFSGHDVTRQCQLSTEQIVAVVQSQPALRELVELWGNKAKRPIALHDPLALATLWSDAVRFEEKCVKIELCGEARGQTRIIEGQPNARVAVEVDAERAVADFLQRMGA